MGEISMVHQDDFVAQKVLEYFYESMFRHFGAGEEDEGNSRSNEIHATDLASLCLRKAYFGKKYPNRFSLDSVMRMTIGTKMHEIRLFTKYDQKTVAYELPLNWAGIKARIDEYYNGIIIDKKTCREVPKGPSIYVAKQLNYYRVIMANNGFNPTSAVVIYIDVDHAYAQTYPVDISGDIDEATQELLSRRDILKTAMDMNIPPPREIGWWCVSCEAASLCFGSQQKEA